jgi:predicted ester cyclase
VSRAGQSLTRQATTNYLNQPFTAYPDASLEIISRGDSGVGLIATQWVLRGTNSGPYFDGTPLTGRTLTLPGASFTQVESDKIRFALNAPPLTDRR